MQLKPLSQQVIVVFGASSGIGRLTATCCAARGARVVVSARDEAGLNSLVDEIRQAGGIASAKVAEVTEWEQVKAVADYAVQEYGGLDTWVHLAAVSIYATFEETSPEEFRRIIDVNLVGQAYGAMAALPYLRQRGGGALIHISSVEARQALPYQGAYAASKHGINGFIESLRMELDHEGAPISVTEVLPASINTPFFNKARTKLGVKPAPVPPVYQPQAVADAILYAAEHPIHEIVVGGAGRAIILGQVLAPRLMDKLLRPAFRLQRTKEPKPVSAPDNLYEPLPGYDRVEGDFGLLAFNNSAYTWLIRQPLLRRLLTSGAVAALGLLATRTLRAIR